jgi:hypothetical protein
VERGALHLLDGGKFDQIPHLTVKVSLGWILRLWQRLQQDCGCCDILTCTDLLRELHAEHRTGWLRWHVLLDAPAN